MSPPTVDKYYLITENDLDAITKPSCKPSRPHDAVESKKGPTKQQRTSSPEKDNNLSLGLPTTLPPIYKLISELESLNQNQNLAPEERWEKYESLMRQYFSLSSQRELPLHLPQPLTASSSRDGGTTTTTTTVFDEFDTLARGLLHTSEHTPETNFHHFRKLIIITLQILPQKLIDKGVAVLNLLQRHNFKFTQNGELYDEMSGSPIYGSNIVDLVHNLLVKKRGNNKIPHGWQTFYSRILNANIPTSIFEKTTQSSSSSSSSIGSPTMANCDISHF